MVTKFSGELRDIKEETQCTATEWECMFKSRAWKEFEDTLHMRLVITRDDLEMQEDVEAHRSQGDARTLRFVLALRKMIESEFKAQDAEKENDDGNE